MRSPLILTIVLLTVSLGGCPRGQHEEPPPRADLEPPQATVPANPATLAEALVGIAFPTSFEMTLPTEDEPTTFLMKMAGRKVLAYRLNTADGSIIAKVAEGVSYHYDPQSKEAFKLSLAEDEGDVPNPYEFYRDDLKISGSEVVDGADCWVVEGSGEGPATLWIDKSTGLMRQAKDGEEIIKFKYARIGAIPDSEFELPEGTKVIDLTQTSRGGEGRSGAQR